MKALLLSLFSWVICILIPITSNAQLQDSLDWIYEKLPAQIFPTGLLHDVSSVHLFTHETPLDPHFHNGKVPGRSANIERMQYVYMDLFHSQLYDSTGVLHAQNGLRLLPWDSLQLEGKYKDKVDVPLMLLWATFNTLDSNSLAKGYLDFHNGQFDLIDEYIFVDDQGQYPVYQGDPIKLAQQAVLQDTTFIGSVLHSSVYSESNTALVTFNLDESEVYQNIGGIDSISVDFADGNGFRKINTNQLISISYQCATPNVENLVKQLRIRGYKNGKTAESRLKFNVVFNTPVAHRELLTNQLPSPPCLPTADPSEGARITVKYANPIVGLQKPVLIIEGFESSIQPYGNLTYKSISSGYVFNENGAQIFQHIHPLSWLYDSLTIAGFDIVHLDFREAKLSLQENEINLLRTIRWINDENPSAEITLIGASMGGVIAKMAINDLAKAGCCYPIVGYGSFDVPHRGAFIPIGLQAASKYYAELLPFVPMARNPWTRVVNSEAARGLLVTHFDPTARKAHEQLLRKAGMLPLGMRTFAIVNGSDMGIPQTLKDPFSRYFRHGLTLQTCVKHAVGYHPDTITFNLDGYRDSLLVFGMEAVAHSHADSYLFQATSFRQLVTALQMNWTARCSARKVQLIAAVGSMIPGLSKAFLSKAIIKRQNRTNHGLAKMKQRMTKGATMVLQHKFPLNYAEVPGGFTGTTEAFKIPILSKIHSPTHCFIPSFSALDVADSLVSRPLRNLPISSFHSFVAPGIVHDNADPNQAHIAVDSTIIAYGLAQLRSIYDEKLKDSLKTSYNVAQEHVYFGAVLSDLGKVLVPKNITLGLARNGFSGAANSATLAASRQKVYCFVGRGCTSDTLHVYGRLQIGDGPDRIASLRVNSSSALVLHKGASLNIEFASRLEIGDGAALIIEKGVSIELDSGAMVLDGTLLLESEAEFRPNGPGQFTFGENAAVLAGKHTVVHLEDAKIRMVSTLEIPIQLDQFLLNQCELSLESQATLQLNCSAQLWNTEFIKTGKKQNGSVIVSNGTVDIQHCQFLGGRPAMSIHDSVQWEMANTTVANAYMGLRATTAPQLFTANSFTGNTTGGHITGGDYLIERSLFHNNDVGLILSGPSKWIQIESCNFSSNSSAGLQSVQSKLHVLCSTFSYNTIGVKAFKGQLKLAKNAGNTFQNNTVGVSFQSLEKLELQQGHNTFSQQVMYDLAGSFAPTTTISYNGSYYYLFADNTSFSKANSNLLTIGKDTVYILYASSQSISALLCPDKGGKKKYDANWSRSDSVPEFAAYPNPGNEWVELVFPATTANAELSVFNPQGEQIFLEFLPVGTHRKQLSISGSVGLYFIRLVDGERMAQLRWLKLD